MRLQNTCVQSAAESSAAVEAELLFVQESEGITFEGDTLTLIGVRPQVLFFTDRPQRVAGYLAFDEFLAEVSEGSGTFTFRGCSVNVARSCLKPVDGLRRSTKLSTEGE